MKIIIPTNKIIIWIALKEFQNQLKKFLMNKKLKGNDRKNSSKSIM